MIEDVEAMLRELRERGWGGYSETKSVQIYLDGDGVRVELQWIDRPHPTPETDGWGHVTTETFYEEAATLSEALVAIMPWATPDEPSEP